MRASHYSGALSPSLIFTWTNNAFEICRNVSLIAVHEKRSDLGRVFYVFFFKYYRCSVHQSVRPIIALRVVRVWSLVFIRKWDSMGTRAVIWLLMGSSLIPSHLFVLSSFWLVITQSTFLCDMPRVVWQQLLSLRTLSSIPFHAPLLFMFCKSLRAILEIQCNSLQGKLLVDRTWETKVCPVSPE